MSIWVRVLDSAQMLIYSRLIPEFNRRYSFSDRRHVRRQRDTCSDFINLENLLAQSLGVVIGVTLCAYIHKGECKYVFITVCVCTMLKKVWMKNLGRSISSCSWRHQGRNPSTCCTLITGCWGSPPPERQAVPKIGDPIQGVPEVGNNFQPQ